MKAKRRIHESYEQGRWCVEGGGAGVDIVVFVSTKTKFNDNTQIISICKREEHSLFWSNGDF